MSSSTRDSRLDDYSPLFERALRVAARFHRQQSRKGGEVPYITHPVGMALLLQRFGFNDAELIAAALLHDVVEDTACTLNDLASQFPAAVVQTVAILSERKRDDEGNRPPWRDRKQEHIEQIKTASEAARAVVLADKLHNLLSMEFDLEAGEDVWSRFNAPRADVEWYHRTIIEAAVQDHPHFAPLARACIEVLDGLQ